LTGAGAAGGLAGGLAALGAELRHGFDVVAEAVGFERALAAAELVVTGEGRLDRTSLAGKVVGRVLAAAARAGTACAIVAGAVDPGVRAELSADVLALNELERTPGEAFSRAAELVEEAAAVIGSRARRAR
jgi:glycerate kinase